MSLTKLVVFDIDGTLLDNLEQEDACYSRALREGLGLREFSQDWASYHDVSDQGIAVEAYEREFGTTPSTAVIERTIDVFVDGLDRAHAVTPVRAVRGAAELLFALRREGWCYAFATGAWRRAAEFKLRAAGLPVDGVVKATSEDGPARSSIVRAAIARAEREIGGSFPRIVSVGDAIWDVETARALALPFVGVGRGARADKLRDAGARHVLRDYADQAVVFATFQDASL
ncbi:MAG TPA: HAD family hydrolase [Gemmatimonadaceae bacterium]|nr:HAD family hydrolase [Gemmatimonadaceae bacterium]